MFAAGPLLTISQAAAALNIPEGTLRKQVSTRKVPSTRLGKHVRFTADHLAAIVAAGEQEVVGAKGSAQQLGAEEPNRSRLPTRRVAGGRRRGAL